MWRGTLFRLGPVWTPRRIIPAPARLRVDPIHTDYRLMSLAPRGNVPWLSILPIRDSRSPAIRVVAIPGYYGHFGFLCPHFPRQWRFAGLVTRAVHFRDIQREVLRQAEHPLASLLDRFFRD
jgi:hypothetical protein